ncbi:MAG: CpcT/CpeT family chromophore lyase [Congregibacter sp.]
MKHQAFALFLSLSLFTALASADTLAEYLSLVVGSFDSSAQAAQDERYDNAIWHTAEIWTGGKRQKDIRWTYSETWLDGADRPYRQRITRHALEDDGGIVAVSFPLPDAERFVGAWDDVSRFSALRPKDLPASGRCSARLARTAARRFEGGTSGQGCRNPHKGAGYVVSQSLTYEGGVNNWDRGFSESGEQVWGPVAGAYRFKRQGANSCDSPVLMLVYGEIFDRAGFGAYIKALGASGLYPQVGGYYRAISPTIDTFEGEPPANRGVVLARFPCLSAAQRFWQSPLYQEIKLLRKDTSRFEVTVFDELPIPDYVNW